MNFKLAAYSCRQVASKFLSKVVISWRHQFANKYELNCYSSANNPAWFASNMPATIQTCWLSGKPKLNHHTY